MKRLLLCLAMLLCATGAFADDAGNPSNPGKMMAGSGRKPLVTKACVRKDGAGVCREWDYTYSVAGASCTENCILFSALDTCKMRNKCRYDVPSGCFKKHSCTKVNAADDCESWDDSPACGN